MIDVKVDEFRVTIPFDYKIVGMNEFYIDSIVDAIEREMSFEKIYGHRKKLVGGKDGYDTVIAWGINEKDYIYLMYSILNPNMKFSLKFGGRALAIYLRQYKYLFNEDISVYEILKRLDFNFSQKIDGVLERVRLSRLDIAIDLIDENLVVNDLYQRIISRKVLVQNKRNSFIDIQRNMGKGIKTETMYFNKRSSNSFLRIYDKKIQQIDTKGIDFHTAINCKSWTRFECELKHEYAHSMTYNIIDSEDRQQFLDLLIKAFCDCFKFKKITGYNGDREILEDTDFYSNIKSLVDDHSKVLYSPVRKHLSDFEEKYMNLFDNGTMSYFQMFKMAYGDDELEELFEQIKADLKTDKVKLNDKHLKMVDSNKNTLPFYKM